MIRTTLIGYGKTGSLIAKLAPSYNIEICAVVDRRCNPRSIPQTCQAFKELTKEAVELSDIAIDFSSGKDILSRIELFAKAQKPMIIGTTGWQEHEKQAKVLIKKHNAALLFAPNFSLGVALFMLLAKQSAMLLHNFSSYDVAISETHHRQKQDAPGGTCRLLANTVAAQYPTRELCYETPHDKALDPEAIHVSARRIGYVPGIHELLFDSAEDSISLTHTARSREGYAKGALEAAFWLIDKKGWYTLDDMIQDQLKKTLLSNQMTKL